MIEFLSQPWPWYTSGAVIAFIMLLLFYFGKTFGFSSNFRTLCAMAGGGKQSALFDFNWRDQIWNLLFLAGSIIGGYISSVFLSGNDAVAISEATINDLAVLGIGAPEGLQPAELFSWNALLSVQGWIALVGGGFLVGFGSRYAGGCTSGHAITGLSTLQLPSFVAVIGFFIGGLFTTHVLFPIIF